MRPRTVGKIVVIVLTFVLLLAALIYALESPEQQDVYKSLRGITLAVMALTFATLYRYVED
jgi:hypothetical protein